MFNPHEYLESFGWKAGNPLQKGGLSKPILVKHKFDQKGLGSNPQDGVAWWERVFDGQLKSMQLGDQGFIQNENKKKEVELEKRRRDSPLYKVFVKGTGLAGSIGTESLKKVKVEQGEEKGEFEGRKMRVLKDEGKRGEESQLMVFDSDSEEEQLDQKSKRKSSSKSKSKSKSSSKSKSKSKKLKSHKTEERDTKDKGKGKDKTKKKGDKKRKRSSDDKEHQSKKSKK